MRLYSPGPDAAQRRALTPAGGRGSLARPGGEGVQQRKPETRQAGPVARLAYRLGTSWRALRHVWSLPPATVQAFLGSYELFERENVGDVRESERLIRDYYGVLNHLCAVGEVEKMYIPPLLDPAAGITGNQLLFERKMAADLALRQGARVLDVGCGRGRVMAHLAELTGARLTGVNVDGEQLASARSYVALRGLAGRCQLREANFNDPLPFEERSFDALYQIQVLTYARDKERLFRELLRVLEPGGRVSFLDWVRLPAFDPADPRHAGLLRRVKPLIGAVETPTPQDLADALARAGFEVLSSADASPGGHQAPLIEKADVFYKRLERLVKALDALRLLPRHVRVLFSRLTKDGEAFVEADRLGLFTSSWQTLARRPA